MISQLQSGLGSLIAGLLETSLYIFAVVILTLFIKYLVLPEEWKERMEYWSNRMQKWFKNYNIESYVAINYDLDENFDTDEFESIISRTFRQEVAQGGVSFERVTDQGEVTVTVNPEHEPVDAISASGIAQESLQVQGIYIEARINANYRDLEHALFDIRDIQQSVAIDLGELGMEANTHSLTCEVNNRPYITRALDKIGVQSMTGMDNRNNIEIEYADDEFRVRGGRNTDFSILINKMVELVTYYG
jgi:hypothetical protein